ncbi:CBS domain-containing protein [Flavilitoribacter nigricans]|nr:CBS domain-containing protein [Flavilitoribacter nigricans]
MIASNIDIALGDVMTRQPHSLSPMDPVERADQLCREYHIHHLPVVDIYGKVIGMLSHSDLLKISYGLSLFRNHDPERFNRTLFASVLVRDIMTRDVTVLDSADTIGEALAIFKLNKFHAIPIVERELLVGIITPLDLLVTAFTNPI